MGGVVSLFTGPDMPEPAAVAPASTAAQDEQIAKEKSRSDELDRKERAQRRAIVGRGAGRNLLAYAGDTGVEEGTRLGV